MQHSDFVHLHNHSDYSLLDGASPIRGMVARAAEFGMPALALTDHGNLFGAVEFYEEARKAGVKPILGMEAYVARGKRHGPHSATTASPPGPARPGRGGLPQPDAALVASAFLEGFYYKPRIDHELLAGTPAGSSALSACPQGRGGDRPARGQQDERACRTAMTYRDIFGPENYFLEIQNHGLEIEAKIRAGMRTAGAAHGHPAGGHERLPLPAHEDAEAHDVLLCIQTGKNVDDPNRLRYDDRPGLLQVAGGDAAALRRPARGAPQHRCRIAERCELELDIRQAAAARLPAAAGAGERGEPTSASWRGRRCARRYSGAHRGDRTSGSTTSWT